MWSPGFVLRIDGPSASRQSGFVSGSCEKKQGVVVALSLMWVLKATTKFKATTKKLGHRYAQPWRSPAEAGKTLPPSSGLLWEGPPPTGTLAQTTGVDKDRLHPCTITCQGWPLAPFPHLQSSQLRPRGGRGSVGSASLHQNQDNPWLSWKNEWMNEWRTWMRIKYMEGQQMRSGTSISSSLRHQRGVNQSDKSSLIHRFLCAEYMNARGYAHTMP